MNAIVTCIKSSTINALEKILKSDMVLNALSMNLTLFSTNTLNSVLTAIDNLLSIGGISNTNPYVIDLSTVGGFEKLQLLESHKNKKISDKATKILDKYFYTTDEDDIEEIKEEK